jgi:hypothetical protein
MAIWDDAEACQCFLLMGVCGKQVLQNGRLFSQLIKDAQGEEITPPSLMQLWGTIAMANSTLRHTQPRGNEERRQKHKRQQTGKLTR